MVWATTRYSASALEQETIVWWLDDQETKLPPKYTQYPEVERRESGQPTQSTSENMVNVEGEEAWS